MSLPYPLEVETGALSGRAPVRRRALPLEQLVRKNIFCRGERLFAFGKELTVEAGLSARAACDSLRKTVVLRMQQRAPFAEERHWRHFSSLMNAQLDHRDTAAHASHVVLVTVDAMS